MTIMAPQKSITVSKPIAESVAGAVRLVKLRLSGPQEQRAQLSQKFARHISTFLDTEVKYPFRYKQISPTAFALNARVDTDTFDRYTISLHEKLVEFLFGSEGAANAEIIVFAGPEDEVQEFIGEPEEQAVDRSHKYLQRVLDSLEKSVAGRKGLRNPFDIEYMAGQRPLLYRGILACPHHVLVAYSITPNAHPAADVPGMPHQDIDLARYLSFRGAEAIDFSIRIFDKASFLLQTSPSEMRSMILLVPLSYRSLMSHNDRIRFIRNAEDHPEWVRERIFLSIMGAPPHPGTSVIQRFGADFAGIVRSLDWQITEPDIDLNLFVGSRLDTVTLDLHASKSKRIERVRLFTRRVNEFHKLRIRTGISGIDTREELDIALNGKISYLSGDAITAPLTSCAPAQKVQISELPIMEPTVLETAFPSDSAA